MMNIEWITKKTETGAITIYNNNITLNKQAADFFQDAYVVAIGIDEETKNLVIKSTSKSEYDVESESNKGQFHKIAISKSYGRITGKALIDEIGIIYNLDFKKQIAYKYSAKWNNGYKMLIVNMNKEEEKNA